MIRFDKLIEKPFCDSFCESVVVYRYNGRTDTVITVNQYRESFSGKNEFKYPPKMCKTKGPKDELNKMS